MGTSLSFFGRFTPSSRKSRRKHRPLLEGLEERVLLATNLGSVAATLSGGSTTLVDQVTTSVAAGNTVVAAISLNTTDAGLSTQRPNCPRSHSP